MNASSLFRNTLSGVALAVLIGATALGQTVTTVPVGAMTYTVAANSTISMGVPLLRPAVWTGVIQAGGTGNITLQQASGQTINLATLLTGVDPYYIEVVGNVDGVTTTLVGDRFEVNEATSISSSNNVLALDSVSTLNTATGSDFSGLVNYRITIRPHWTLAALFGTGNGTNINASSNVNNADQVLAWTGSGFSIYYFRSGTTPQWRNTSTGTTSQDQAIIPPGVGVYFKRASSDYSLTLAGDVRANTFIRPLGVGSQLIANGFPIDLSPNNLNQSVATGYVASTSITSADQLLAWVGGGYSIYYLRSGTTSQWRNTSTGTTDQSTYPLYVAGGAVLYFPRGTPNDIVQNVPYSLN